MSAKEEPAVAASPIVAPVDLLWEGSLMLDALRDEAWRHVLNYPSWQGYSEVTHLSGPPGGEGEVVRLAKDEEGFTFPPYFARTIKIDPPIRVMWKTYPEEGTVPDFLGVVEFTLEAVGAQTRFGFMSLYEFRVPHNEEAELDEFREEQEENFGTLFASTFEKLKNLVEG